LICALVGFKQDYVHIPAFMADSSSHNNSRLRPA
jgi:hypothetical protein